MAPRILCSAYVLSCTFIRESKPSTAAIKPDHSGRDQVVQTHALRQPIVNPFGNIADLRQMRQDQSLAFRGDIFICGNAIHVGSGCVIRQPLHSCLLRIGGLAAESVPW